jgi:plasmid stabilization system protein ParE
METRETIMLDARAQRRLLVLTHVLAGELTLREAAAYLELSERQVRRLADGLARGRGPAALVHGNRGRSPADRLEAERRARIVALAD